jgi:PAS domain S-box-containing protein
MPMTMIDPAWLMRFIRGTAVATWLVEGDGYVMDVPEWIELTGQTAAEAEGDGWMNAIHPEDVPRVRAAWQTAVVHHQHYNTDYRVRCADGIYRWFNARGLPMLDGDGNALKWFGVILSIAGAGRFGRSEGAERWVAADRYDDISPAALRAARALLDWPAERLAGEAGVSRSTIRRLEDEEATIATRKGSIHKILQVLARERIRCFAQGGTIIGVSIDSAM